MNETPKFSVSEFIEVCNQTLDYAYASTLIEGEISSFKVNQGKWVFFDLKDDESSLSCFMPLFKLRTPLEDGMKILVRGYPKLTKWGKFSFTVEQIMPVGEGSIKKAFEMLKKKLEKEGLFAPERKRPLPENLTKIGVISSTGAAGYADFCKIINARWGGLEIQTAHTQVQGMDAPRQIISALKYLNEKSEVQLIAIIRGGGSADDLSCFNDEDLARAIAASKIPVITGIGHEVDESLADLVADLRASTPSNVAELITPDKVAIMSKIKNDIRSVRTQLIQSLIHTYEKVEQSRESARKNIELKLESINQHLGDQTLRLNRVISQHINTLSEKNHQKITELRRIFDQKIQSTEDKIESIKKILNSLNPNLILRQGYAIVTGKLAPGDIVEITTEKKIATAEIKSIKERN